MGGRIIMPSPERFEKTLRDFAISNDVIADIYDGFQKLTDKEHKRVKAVFFRQALLVMNEKLPKEQVKVILEANACSKSGVRERNSKEFARINQKLSIEDRLKLISNRAYMNMGKPELDKHGFLIVHAVSYRPTDKFECACPTISKIKRDYNIPKEYCYCCGGHFKYHYEIMLGVKLDLLEIVSSPHDTDGEKPCVFKYQMK